MKPSACSTAFSSAGVPPAVLRASRPQNGEPTCKNIDPHLPRN